MYNSDTVYTTTTFRPVSPSPITPPLDTSSPQRTRKLETPLHFDGGLFSDIRSTDGKLLSKVTVDRVQRSTRHDITDSPSVTFDNEPKENNYVDDIIKTETITNKDFITVKFTPVPPELDTPRLQTPSQMYQLQQTPSPIQYIKDNFEDLQSYKIVNSVCKENLFETDNLVPPISFERNLLNSFDVSEPIKRACSPLANQLISEQLTKIDSYLQESLEVCSGVKQRFTPTPVNIEKDYLMDKIVDKVPCNKKEEKIINFNIESQCTMLNEETLKSSKINVDEMRRDCEPFVTEQKREIAPQVTSYHIDTKNMSKLNSVSDKHPGVLSAIYNMPIHYHAAILCFLLIIYNLIYQYIKQNCSGNNNKIN